MKTILTVIKHEFLTVVTSRSFLLVLFLLPLSGLVVMFITSSANSDNGQNALGEIFAPEEKQLADGYVDLSGIVSALPEDLQNLLFPYADERAAETALQNGEIGGYYLIPAGYLGSGELQYVQAEYDPFSGLESTGVMEKAIDFNLLGGDQTLAARIDQPMKLEMELLGGQAERDPTDSLTFFLPYIVTFLFYFIIFGSASMMLNNLTNEKQNRMIEILMTSLSPTQMIAGKIIALGLVGWCRRWCGARRDC